MKLNIRKAKIEDIKDIVNIKINGWKVAYKDILKSDYLDSMDYDKNFERFKLEIENKSLKENIVIEDNNTIVGYAKISILKKEEYDSQIYAIYIRPDVKNMGYGTLLMNYIKEYFKSKGCKNMILWCIDKNEQAKIFYRKQGGIEKNKIMSKIGEEEVCEVSFLFEL